MRLFHLILNEKKIGKVKQLHMQMLALTSSFTEKMIKHLESLQDLLFIWHFTEIRAL